nr:uncharacterized protein LOC111507648 [Leptinotarsa decemlineata]
MYLIVVFSALQAAALADVTVVQNLMGEPDYRQVRLHWEVNSSAVPKNGFSVRYCELQTWGAQRCRIHNTTDSSDRNNIDAEDNLAAFKAEIKGLRMATTYTFEVRDVKDEKGEREERAEGDDKNQNIIVIPTKGFSAKATQCLPHASEIEVSTGPFFGGRIAVEATDGERCAIDGEPDSPRDTYTLRINHTECGSQVNETTVATFVLVQENLPILTHSTRRWVTLIELCHVKEEVGETIAPISHRSNIVPIFVITMLVIAGVISIVALVLKLAGKKLIEEFDNISIASDISTSSCSTVTEIEASETNKEKSKGESPTV